MKSCATCEKLHTCEIDTSHIEDWDGTKDFCSKYSPIFQYEIIIPDDFFVSLTDLNAKA